MTTMTKATRVLRGSSANTKVHVCLDPNTLDRIELVRTFVEVDTGQRLSTSLVVRLALHMLATRIQQAGTIGSLTGQVKAAAVGQ